MFFKTNLTDGTRTDRKNDFTRLLFKSGKLFYNNNHIILLGISWRDLITAAGVAMAQYNLYYNSKNNITDDEFGSRCCFVWVQRPVEGTFNNEMRFWTLFIFRAFININTKNGGLGFSQYTIYDRNSVNRDGPFKTYIKYVYII